jgi:hypothetical protein
MTWYCCAPLRYSDEQPLVAVAVRLHESPPKSPKSRPWREAEIAAMVAMVAKKSEQGPPNPEQGCFHCRTPEPTAGPSSCMCRWCAHKKSREKVPSGSRAAVRKSLGRVRLIYPLQYLRCSGISFVTRPFVGKACRPATSPIHNIEDQYHPRV